MVGGKRKEIEESSKGAGSEGDISQQGTVRALGRGKCAGNEPSCRAAVA